MTYFLPEIDDTSNIKPTTPDVQPTGWFEGTGAAYKSAQLENDSNFRIYTERRKGFADRANKAMALLGEDTARAEWEKRGLYVTGSAKETIEANPKAAQAVIEMGRTAQDANPEAWAGIDLTEEGVDAEVNATLQAEYEDAQGILDMMQGGRTSAGLIGSMSGMMVDVKNLPFMAFGGSGSFLRVVGTEAAINVGAELAFLPSQFEAADRLDIPDPNIATQILMAAGAGAVFGGLIEAGARGIKYATMRTRQPRIGNFDDLATEAIITATEDALIAGENPLKAAADAAARNKPEPPFAAENPLNPMRPPLRTPEQVFDDAFASVQAGAIDVTPIPATPDAPLSDETLIAYMDQAIADAKAQDSVRSKPLAHFLARGHQGPNGRSESLQIHPEGTAASELRAMGITNKTYPGLFSKKGRKDLDNLVASEMEDMFPGITDAAGLADDGRYLDPNGLYALIARDAEGDSSWLRTRKDVMDLEKQLIELERDIERGVKPEPVAAPEPPGLVVDQRFRDYAEFDGGDADEAIQRAVDDYLAENGYFENLRPEEIQEIHEVMRTVGGDIEDVIYSARARERDYVDLHADEARNYEAVSFPDDAFAGPGALGLLPEGEGRPRQDAGAAADGAADARLDGGAVPEAAGGQLLIPGTERIDTGLSQRQRAEMDARAQQSKIRRLDQTRVEDDETSLFGGNQRDLFSDPASKEARVAHDAIADDLRTKIGGEPGDVRISMKVVGGATVPSARGKMTLLHGYSGKDAATFVRGYDGDRYVEGNVFGDDAVYFDGDGKWTANDYYAMQFSVERVAEVEVEFDNALVLNPESAREITDAVRKRSGSVDGSDISAWARDNGYDGVIVTGFDRLQRETVGPIPRDYMGEDGPISDRLRAFRAAVEEVGMNDDIAQDQVLAFAPENMRVVRDGLEPGTSIVPIESIMNGRTGRDYLMDMGDGKGERLMSDILDELDADDLFSARIDLCGKGPA